MKKEIKNGIYNLFDLIDFDNINLDNTSLGFPVYHIHIRKTAGTSINYAFIENLSGISPSLIFNQLSNKFLHRSVFNNEIFVGWNKTLIEKGKYSYAFSHIPFHRLDLPSQVFKFTCFRDPVKRIISHYNMLKYYDREKIDHPCMKREGKWIKKDFDYFIDSIPPEHLMNQLYMFSENLDVNEAIKNASLCNAILFQENLEEDIQKLSRELGIKLCLKNEKSYNHKEEISINQIHRLKEVLKKEYQFLDSVRNQIVTSEK